MIFARLRLLPIAISVAASGFVGWSAFAQKPTETLTLSRFMSSYLDQLEDLKAAEFDVKTAGARLEAAGDTLQSQLEIVPGFQNQRTRLLRVGTEATDKAGDLSAKLTQLTPLGTFFTFRATQSLTDREAISVGIVDKTYSLGISQPLWKNSFGRLYRIQQAEAGAGLKAQESALHARRLQACKDAVALYSAAWLADRRVTLLEQIVATSKNALDATEASARSRLVRRLDLLSARADHLRVQDLLVQAKNARVDAFASVQSFASESLASLADLDEFFAGRALSFDVNSLENTPGLVALKNQVEANAQAVRVARENSRSDVSLGLEAGQTEGRLPLTAGVEEYRESFAKLSLTFSFPLVNQTLSSEVARAEYARGRAEAELAKALRETRTGLTQQASDIQSLREQTKISAERADLLQSQIREAFGVMRSGRMEFEDYLRYRDQYLNEKLKSLDLVRRLWVRQAELAALTEQTSFVCGESR